MEYSDVINVLQSLQQDSCPEGVEHHMFGDMVKFVKEQQEKYEEGLKHVITLTEEVNKLKELKEDAFQEGFDEGREEYQVDTEYLEEKDEEIDKLKEQVEKLKEDAENIEEAIRLVGNQETIYACNKIWYECCPSEEED